LKEEKIVTHESPPPTARTDVTEGISSKPAQNLQ